MSNEMTSATSQPTKRIRVLIVVNVDWFFLSHRAPIAEEALQQGYDVHLACTVTESRSKLEYLERQGLVLHPIEISRSSLSLTKILYEFLSFVLLFRAVRPNIAHLVTIKPVLLGGIAARLTRVPAIVAAVSGLGFAFSASGFIWKAKRLVIGQLYRLVLTRKNTKVIFQNPNDKERILELGNIPDINTQIIPGSGVDLSEYEASDIPPGRPVVLLATRLLRDKGVLEYLEAARLLKATEIGRSARFVLAGSPDPGNLASLSWEELGTGNPPGLVELWGHQTDMRRVIAAAHIVVLPSYREGLPKVLIEAAACARAVITTDRPGCRDAIEPGVTGLLVPAQDAQALATAISRLLEDPEFCRKLGLAGRSLAETRFDVKHVVAAHMGIYRTLAERSSSNSP